MFWRIRGPRQLCLTGHHKTFWRRPYERHARSSPPTSLAGLVLRVQRGVSWLRVHHLPPVLKFYFCAAMPSLPPPDWLYLKVSRTRPSFVSFFLYYIFCFCMHRLQRTNRTEKWRNLTHAVHWRLQKNNHKKGWVIENIRKETNYSVYVFKMVVNCYNISLS